MLFLLFMTALFNFAGRFPDGSLAREDLFSDEIFIPAAGGFILTMTEGFFNVRQRVSCLSGLLRKGRMKWSPDLPNEERLYSVGFRKG